MANFLIWLSGKKSVIATILMAIVGYVWNKGYIGQEEFALISTLIGLIFGYTSYRTGKAFIKKVGKCK